MKSKFFYNILGLKYGFDMKSYRQFVSESEHWDKKQWREYHNELLPIIIMHAYQHVSYYRNLFDEYGINPVSIKNEDDLQEIPITQKQDLRTHPELFVADNAKEFRPMRHHTGGTTGRPCPYMNDRKSWALNWAVKMQTFSNAGYQYGVDKLAVMAGGSLIPGKSSGFKHQIWRWINNYFTMPITHMTSEIMDEYIKTIINNRIRFLRGYPSAIASFAEYVISTNQQVPLQAVFTTAEMLYSHQRELIYKAFGCETWDSYGCGDGMGQAVDCKEHDKMHVCEQVSIMQLVDEKGCEVSCGEEGEVVLTSLYDYAMPFIRYAPGDYAVKGSGNCVCGKCGKTIDRIVGRSSDVFRFSNGRILNGLSFPIEDMTEEIERFQIIQTEKDRVEVLFEIRNSIDNVQINKIKRLVEYHCGDGVSVNVKIVDKIEVPVSEKFRYVVSRIS